MLSRRQPLRGFALCSPVVRVLLATAVLAAVLAVVAVASAELGPDRVVEVVARRFAFEPAEIEVLEGERVRLVLRSADTTHGLELEAFDVKVEIPRGGDAVSVEFFAGTPGSYRFKCSEYCGSGHSGMKGRLVVRPKAEP